jgi:hypothetical protein
MVTWEPAGFRRYVHPTADEAPTAFQRRRVPSVEAIITVSTRRGWHQRAREELFSPDLEERLLKIGMAERARVGMLHEVIVTATALHSDSVQTVTWPAGRLYPELAEFQHVEPPFAVPTGFDEHGEPTGFPGDDDPPHLPGVLDPLTTWNRRNA